MSEVPSDAPSGPPSAAARRDGERLGGEADAGAGAGDSRWARWGASTVALVVALLVVHGWLALYDLVLSPDAMHDVDGVYRRWMQSADAGRIIGIDAPWVYPAAALLPLLLAWLPGPALFPVSWVVLVTALDVAAALLLVRWGGVRGRAAAWWFTGFLLAVGPVAIGRLDGVAVPLVLVGIVLLARRPAVAGALLGLATWIKVWPAAVVLAVLVAVRGRLRLVVGGLVVSILVVGGALLLGAGANVTSFLTMQTGRGLQIESVGALPFLWSAALGLGDGEVYYDRGILTFQVRGTGTDAAASALDPVLALAVLAVLVLAVLAMRRTRDGAAVLPVALLGLTAALLVGDKVLSPQYLTWFAPVVVLVGLADAGVRRRCRRAVRAVVAAAILTQVVYPYLYFLLLLLNPAVLVVLTVRDILLVGVLVWAVVALGRMLGSRSSAGPREAAATGGRLSPPA